MRGTIVRWVDDRGFGFINSDDHQGDIFVHISKFEKGFRHPEIGDSVEFQLVWRNGKANAHFVSLVGVAPNKSTSALSSILSGLLACLVLGSIGYFTYGKVAVAPAYENMGFRCEGKTYCSQMRSCDEAKFYLANCPNVKIDGDNDGEPCEMQWCTH
ncbi:cold shock domain-containing protein [Vibrio chagasii]|uniref:cold shock domain-containing protein n=1 Tax=Vibrio chagasii TaxID=170679 RepID=UPI003DA06C9C